MPATTNATHTPETLQAIQADVSEVQDKLAVLIGLMQTHGVPSLVIGYHTETIKALEKIHRFADDGLRSFREDRRTGRGFGTVGAESVPVSAGTVPVSVAKDGKKRSPMRSKKPAANP